ncbi:MAG: translation initiation factor IF-2 N-terminal domain-containing protein, partial [Acidobacteriota bacterium]|nr:translation initiation factor IF-2 N-terminal domain-containing protein [Acidobacteriota bacterium]
MGKIRVEELAAQMGIGSKEVLFLLQSIGVDVKSPQAALDESTVLAILQGKTHAPKQLIVRDTEARAPRPQKSALSRIKIIEKPPGKADDLEPEPVPASATPAAKREKPSRAAVPAEPARTAVVPEEEPEPAREAPAPASAGSSAAPPAASAAGSPPASPASASPGSSAAG